MLCYVIFVIRYTMHTRHVACHVLSEYMTSDVYFLCMYYLHCAICMYFCVIGLGLGISLKHAELY